MLDLFQGISDNDVKPFKVREGFARITHEGVTDIFLVQNMELPGGYVASLAFELDDFDPERNPGTPLVLTEGDHVDHLGPPMDLFEAKAPVWEASLNVLRSIPKDYGLLPAIRALEFLKTKNRLPSPLEVNDAIKQAVDDYHQRRAKLAL